MAPARTVTDLSCDESFRSAAGKIIWTRFEEMMSFRDAALSHEDGVHDMRVASRRLRAALELFGDVFQDKHIRPLLREVKDLAGCLGTVRDLDVLMGRLRKDRKGRTAAQQLALDLLLEDLERHHEEARANLRQDLERLQRRDFSRRFLSVVAKETM